MTVSSENDGQRNDELNVLRARAGQCEKQARKYREVVRNLSIFKAIVERSDEAIAVYAPNGKVVYANRAWQKLFGLSLAQAHGLKPGAGYTWESEQTFCREIVPRLQQGNTWEGVLQALSPGDKRFKVWQSFKALKNKKGKFSLYFSFGHRAAEHAGGMTEKRGGEGAQPSYAHDNSDFVYALKHFDDPLDDPLDDPPVQ
ncbi:MAG: PAS domain S-box protein [Lentisphaerae bacterium]|nr:PAS domain S-box protein [Lentisphaerota bacterium]